MTPEQKLSSLGLVLPSAPALLHTIVHGVWWETRFTFPGRSREIPMDRSLWADWAAMFR